MSGAVKLDHDWTDDDDRPLGGWVEVSIDELRAIVAEAGGLRALDVFSSLTDPDSQIYTSWGRPGDPHPLVDMRDYKEDGRTTEVVCRRFVRVDDREVIA